MKGTVRVAVVGLGDFGARHLDILAGMQGVEVVALVSRSETRTAELAARHRVPATFRDTAGMVAAVAPDAVYVVTEDTRHFEPTMAALKAGADVFLEKPISHDLGEARAIVDAAAALGRRLMIGHVLRFDPAYVQIKEKAAAGGLGRIVSIHAWRNMIHSLAAQYAHSNRFYTTGIHDVDLALWLYGGRRPVEVSMKTLAAFGAGDDVFWATITMEDGSLAVVETNWILPGGTPWRGHFGMTVHGTGGAAVVEVPGNNLRYWSEERAEDLDTRLWPTVYGKTAGLVKDEDEYFIRCVRDGEPIDRPRAEESYEALRVAQAAVRSAREGVPVKL